MRRERAGFTLVELLVALSIGAAVLMSARALLDGLADHARSTVRAMHDTDAEANGERLARQLAGNLIIAPDLAPSFVGAETEASFDSWCPAARGGLERCGVRLALASSGKDLGVVLSLSTGATVVLLRGANANLRYLSDAADGGHWQEVWRQPQTPPLAVAATVGGRSLVLRIGERR
jgi:prepilin-type N-terminal cleavage/methylation domain-containing protein